MAIDRSYADYVLDLLAPLGDVSARPMFGGFGVRHGDDNFGLITRDSTLYFKVDDASRPDYEKAGGAQFMTMPYWSVPADVLEDEDLRLSWARDAIEVGHRTAKPKKKATKKKASSKKKTTKKKA